AVRTGCQEIASPSRRQTRNARRGWLTTGRSMSLVASLDLVARACHPPAGAGPSAGAPRTAESTARWCVVVPNGERARVARSRRRIGCRARSPNPFSSNALDRLPQLEAPNALVDSHTSQGETAFHLLLQIQAHDRLSDSVRHRRHPEDPNPSLPVLLRYFDCPHQRREVTP